MRSLAFLRFSVVGLLLVLGLPGATQAGFQVPFKSCCDEGFTSAPEVKESQGKALFFNSLVTHNSEKGAVKTFSVRVADRNVRRLARPEIGSIQKFAEYRGKGPVVAFTFPVSGEISSYFGNRRHPYRILRRFHTGIDITAKPGTPIKVVAPGRVIYSGWGRGYGLMVEVDHGNGLSTVYAHCSRLSVRLGEIVASGNAVGEVGRTGVTTGPHLHFEVRRKGASVDPMRFMAR